MAELTTKALSALLFVCRAPVAEEAAVATVATLGVEEGTRLAPARIMKPAANRVKILGGVHHVTLIDKRLYCPLVLLCGLLFTCLHDVVTAGSVNRDVCPTLIIGVV